MLLIKNAELNGYLADTGANTPVDVLCHNGLIKKVGKQLEKEISGTLHQELTVVDANGGALIPGLHDHHMHLLSLAATSQSLKCGPPEICHESRFRDLLENAPGSGWIRGYGYHESVAGDIDRWRLDNIVSHRPVRIQHRSGKVWIVNSLAAQLLDLERIQALEGVEQNRIGEITGRLFRLDRWIKRNIGTIDQADLSDTSAELASYGVTGITDTSPDNDDRTLNIFQQAVDQNHLRQRVYMMGNENLSIIQHPKIKRGPLKILLDEIALPDFQQLIGRIEQAHLRNRPVAIHCVTKTELVFALTSLKQAGPIAGDRIEHASVTTDDMFELMQQCGITVVTQPGFLDERGAEYQSDVEEELHDSLYRCRSFIEHDIPLAGSTDAPYGPANPWQAIKAATERKNKLGYQFGPDEILSPEQALKLFLTCAEAPGGACRTVTAGKAADLCLLSKPWAEIRERLDSADVRLTVCDAEVIFSRD